MSKYLFLLGQSTDLASEELRAILGPKNSNFELIRPNFVLAETDYSPEKLINILGGTIKIAQYIDTIDNLEKLDANYWYKLLHNYLEKDKKNYFGFSLHNDNSKNYKNIRNIALELKRVLKENKYKSRLVTAQGPILSSVIVSKNKLLDRELIIVKNDKKYILALTKSVQDFQAYGFRDMKRPQRDDKSGMLPPKVAQMMINLAGNDRDKKILDPFCGSGTVLQEAMLLGYKDIYGSDISKKAVDDSNKNLSWLGQELNIKATIKIIKSDINNIDQHIKNNSIDLIVTEPFMGDARQILRIKKSSEINKIKNELQSLYKNSFSKFKKILSTNGLVVFVFPVFDISGQNIYSLDKNIISDLGFKYQLEEDIVYSRQKQKVKRQITVWKLK